MCNLKINVFIAACSIAIPSVLCDPRLSYRVRTPGRGP